VNRAGAQAYCNRKLSEGQKAADTARSKVRVRVEHVFGDQMNGMGAELVSTIGIVRTRCKTGMTILVYNMRRFVCVERMAAAAAG
jgi:transposase, IS5 family